ncbi:GNAT family N-acetyltransferase [Yokenella regensburgei]|uniref:GNAT family N-acetyltransferase n=1 Tax=Yokenella regensburgei TaxID=158877 RepID=UPI003F162B51
MHITEAEEHHIPAIHAIYAWHVAHGTASFETEIPTPDDMLVRLNNLRDAGLPWFVLIHEGSVKGYCYLSRYRTRAAYRYTLEDSIYIDNAFCRQGAGKKLLARAIAWAEAHGYRQLICVVGNSENEASLALHQRAGFTLTGTLKNVGFKHNRWLDIVILQRMLGEGALSVPKDAHPALTCA